MLEIAAFCLKLTCAKVVVNAMLQIGHKEQSEDFLKILRLN